MCLIFFALQKRGRLEGRFDREWHAVVILSIHSYTMLLLIELPILGKGAEKGF